MNHQRSKGWFYPLVLLLFTTACQQVKQIVNRSSPREAFYEALSKSPIKDKTFVQNWHDAWTTAVENPTKVTLPYGENGLFFPDDEGANALQMELMRGEKLTIVFTSTANIFAELYRADNLDEKPLTYLDPEENQMELEISATGTYILLFQPELMSHGSYMLSVTKGPSVGFPVAGKNSSNIQSFWGAVRDGGKRSHEGVDIFAPRGTPVLAVTGGTAYASTNRLGGKVVWQRGENGERFYYAHLDSQAVSSSRVQMGDTIGFVGNTGNARYTPPHLHFGIYARGAVDPFPYIHNLLPALQQDTIPPVWENRLASISSTSANFRNLPTTKSRPDTVLKKHTVVSLKSVVGDWLRAALPNGKTGYLHSSVVTELDTLVSNLEEGHYTAMSDLPGEPLIDSVLLKPTPTYGSFGSYQLIRHESGRYLWVVPAS